VTKRFPKPLSELPVSRPRRLAIAISRLVAGGFLLGADPAPVFAELPVPANVLVAPGAGSVLPPVISGNTMVIQQLSDKATLDWKSFNIGPENTVRFEQPAATSVALNNIHQSDPSLIFGTLTANGQVYLINQNGFVFGPNAQVNVNTLLASSLNISAETFQKGIIRAFEDGSPALSATDKNGQPVKQLWLKDDKGQPVLDGNGQKIKVQIKVEAGASIKTNASDGRIILAAPSVTNQGSLEAPGGQVIMAASQDKVYLQLAGTDAGFNGLLVEVGTGGDVNNIGKVLAERGNASLIGFAVNQLGMASASTSVRINGSVRLLAREGVQDRTLSNGLLKPSATQRAQDLGDGLGTRATVNLGGGSQTRVDLDTDKSQTAIDSQPQQASRIEISGHQVYLRQNAKVLANSGNVTVSALDDPNRPQDKGSARIYLESGSSIDVSGVKNVSLPMERNVLAVELRKNELRDVPLQRDGILYGRTVAVDLRDAIGPAGNKHIPIADIQGALDRIARTIDERSTTGGAIALQSSGDLITRPGSVLDFSGGSVAYRDGYIATSKLMDAQGRIYDIGKADPNRVYTAIFGEWIKTWTKWGITETWSIPGPLGRGVFEKGYVQGAAAGSLDIAAFESQLDGILNGKTIAGIHQREASRQAEGSTLSIDLTVNSLNSKQDVVFARSVAVNQIGLADPLPRSAANPAQAAALNLKPSAFKDAGISHVAITTNGAVKIEGGAPLEMPADGSLKLAGQGVEVQGSILAPAGDVSLLPSNKTLPSPITLGSSASIDVRGQWVNDLLDKQQGRPLGAFAIDGGSVDLESVQGNLVLAAGSRIDASGGAWLQGDASLTAGLGGSIKLSAATLYPGGSSSLILGGQLRGGALKQGGSLSLESNEVVIGPAGAVPVRAGSTQTPLVLSADFFRQGGFADYTVRSNVYGLKLADGLQLKPLQANLALAKDAYSTPTGGNPFQPGFTVLPDTDRQPANLTLGYAGRLAQKPGESLSIGKGALIQVDPKGSVELDSDTSIFVNGAIVAPAGNIALSIVPPASSGADTGFFASQGIWLGESSRLSAPGVFLPAPALNGLNTGEVLDGGTISLTANRGYIVAQQHSLLDASGTSASVDFWENPAQGPLVRIAQQTIASAGGSINLTAAEGIIADGAFSAKAGGEGVAGGALKVELNRLNISKAPPGEQDGKIPFPNDVNPNQPQTIRVSELAQSPLPEGFAQGSALPTQSVNGQAWLDAGQINAGGFSSITLKTEGFNQSTQSYGTRILFQGDVSLRAGREIILDSPVLAWAAQSAGDSAMVALEAPYVALGSSQSRIDKDLGGGHYATTLAPDAQTGKGQFQVKAKGIELIGGLSFNGFGQARLESSGDVRVRGIGGTAAQKDYLGELKFAGDLAIKGGQIYPASLTDYQITVTGSDSQGVSFLSNGGPVGPVYSALGSLSVTAPNILQQGVLKAPFGSLSLNASNNLVLAAGSQTSVSGEGRVVPLGRGSGGQYWLYPLNNQGSTNIVIDAPPEKRLSLSGKNVDLRRGASLDVSGGGELYAYEFIQGSGGSYDVLDPTSQGYQGSYAILPGVQSILTPYDPLEFSTSGLRVGDSVTLGGAVGLPAGQYTLLPAHYALLPGAYLVTPRSDMGIQAQGQSRLDTAGIQVVAGRLGVAETSLADANWRGFAVEAGSMARVRSEFKDYYSNSFFADKAVRDQTARPPLAMDAGTLDIYATASLSIVATLRAGAAGNGSGGQVDISGDRLAIVGRREDIAQAPSGSVAVLAEELNALNAPSLLLGGSRSRSTAGQRLTVSAKTLDVAGDVGLIGPEILLAATDWLRLEAGAQVESSGKPPSSQTILSVSNVGGGSDGGFIGVSGAGQVEVIRDQAVTGKTGSVVVEAGAKLKAEGSMLLDSTQDTLFAGDILMQGGSLGLKSSKISIGDAPANTPGLVLKSAAFSVDALKLSSASDLNLYGGAGLSVSHLDINAAAINGFGNAGQTSLLTGDVIRLGNAGSTAGQAGTGTGSLSLKAREIVLGSGHYAVTGFQQVALEATQSITGQGQTIDPFTQKPVPAGQGQLSVGGELSLSAGSIRGGAGATTVVDATGHAVSIAAPGGAFLGDAGLGASWTIQGDSIQNTGRFDLPSGILRLKALRGDLVLGDGTDINLAGTRQSFATLDRFSPGGKLVLQASPRLDGQGKTGGNVRLDAGASVHLAGATDAAGAQASDAGRVEILASGGQLDWNGSMDSRGAGIASPGFLQGQITLDVAGLGAGGFSALNSKLAAGGFTGSVSLEQRQGDVTIAAADIVKAGQFELLADQGQVNIEGTIDASGPAGGVVSIYGRDGIRLAAGGLIDASASKPGAAGGKLSLDTVHRDDAGFGLLDLAAESAAGAGINVSGGTGGAGGSIHLRTGRDVGAVTAINTRLQGADPLRTVLEATRIYQGISTITAADIVGWQADTAAYMAAAQAPANAAFTLLPGIEIRSQGNLSLQDRWESFWRYADAGGNASLPGFLTLRAGGDLNINASLTDAFATSPIPGVYSFLRFQDTLQPGQSWSFNLVAGGDINLAPSYSGLDPADPASGVIADGLQTVVRTGTGGIDMQAGGGIRFLADAARPQAAAAVYTMGRPASYSMADIVSALQGNPTIPGLPAPNPGESQADYLARLDPVQMNTWLRYGFLNVSFDDIALPAARFLAEYPSQGGSIRLKAGGSIEGIETGQLLSDWLVRNGTWDGANPNSPTAWGINISSDFDNNAVLPSADGSYFYFAKGNRGFNQNIGALGGGDVTISAGGDVQNLSAMLPTTGKPFAIWNEQRQFISNAVIVNGGGELQVTAGGNISGGEFYAGLGSARLEAGGAIAKSASGLGSLLELGEAGFTVQARGDVTLGSVFNPTVIRQKIPSDPLLARDAYFFTYDPQSSVSVQSVAGDVVLQNDIAAIKRAKGLDPNNTGSGFEFTVYPGSLQATALSGDIRVNNSFTLFPSAQGKLELLAGGDIGTDAASGIFNVNVSDADPALLPAPLKPANVLDGDRSAKNYQARERLDATTPDGTVTHAKTPVHQGSLEQSSIIAKAGNIAFPASTQFTWYLPQASQFIAGGDIRNLSLSGQNLSAYDTTLIQAGRDFRYDSPLDSNGLVQAINQKIQLGGPGRLQVLTGRDINLGSSTGLLSIGNLANSSLPAGQGASISVLAGLSDKIDFKGFLDKYFGTGGKYYSSLDEYQFVQDGNQIYLSLGADSKAVGQKLDLTRDEKLKLLERLPQSLFLAFVEPYLFNEIKESSAAAAIADTNHQAAAYKQGFEAIETLFPGQGYAGDIALVFSQIKTLAGGTIDLMAPGGKMDVGLAGKNGGIAKKPDQLGIVVQQSGDLNALSLGDFNVNQSRVFTMGGGDIAVWSSAGSIDAGKGAKSAISAPPPITTIDQDGNPQTIFPPVVSGSGIQAISNSNNAKTATSETPGSAKDMLGLLNSGRSMATGLLSRVHELKYPRYSPANTVSADKLKKQIDEAYAKVVDLWIQANAVQNPAGLSPADSRLGEIKAQLTGIIQSAAALAQDLNRLQSGQTLVGTLQADVSNVYLAAPHGIVDAGEAGISGNNVVIAATAVIGASNIQASGTTSGVPAAVTVPVVATGADAAAAGAAKSSSEQLLENAAKPAPVDDKAVAKAAALSSLQADVVGFGHCSVGDVREGKAGCGG